MDSIVNAIVTPVVESLMVPVKKHIGYLISCTKYVSDVGIKKTELDAARLGVENRMNHNKCNHHEVPPEVSVWLKEVGEIDAKVEGIPSDVGSCFNLKLRHKLGRKAFKIIEEIKSLIEKRSTFDWTDHPIPLGKVHSTKASTSTPSSHHDEFKSRDLTFKKALEALQADHKSHMIALCGMGGVGKTTLMQKLKMAVSEKKMFDYIIVATIGEKTDPIAIQQAVAEFLSVDLKETTKEARAIKLRECFEAKPNEGKKFLVILDDVWQFVDMNDIGLSPLANQGIDFKVLLTSRDREVCIMMGVKADSILNVEVLTNLEAQCFFHQLVTSSDDADLDFDLRKIGDDIASRCRGLPIAIKTIAYTLKSKSKHVWEDTLSRLKHHDVDEVVRRIFEISYNNLQNEETGSTLLLCGLFPEDFDIPTEDLMRYGWGLKLFNNVYTIQEARNRLNTCIERLINANLLIQSQKLGCVKMHDLVRVFVLDKCSKGKHASIVGNMSKRPTKHATESCKRISLTCTGMPEFPREYKYPNLLLLKLMNGDKLLRFPQDFYEEMESLEVIAYESMKYPLLPRSLHCSTNLRTLCLHQCYLMFDCSSIGNLLNLEVLSFANCGIRKLPSTIGNLKELKLLDLSGCIDLRIDDGALKKLVNLEELYMSVGKRNIFDDLEGIRLTDANVDELVERSKKLIALEIEFFDMNTLPKNMSFKYLERFKISLGCYLNKNDGQNQHSFDNTLMLVTNKCELLDSGINELFEKTEVLHLQVDDMNDLGDGMVESLHNHQFSFYNLRVLEICKCANLKYLFTVHLAHSLTKLERLTISGCPVLETLVDGENSGVEAIKFQALKFLSLKKLPELMSLCNDVSVIELPQLEELRLDSLPNFTSICADNESATSSSKSNDIGAMQPFLKKEVMISHLKILNIRNMEKLKEIWPSNSEEVSFSNLREIKVEGCDNLVNLFPSNLMMLLLHHLEDIQVSNCASIDVLFDIDLRCVGEMEGGSNNLRRIEARGLRKLREVWRVKGACNSNLPILGFQAVEYIKIEGCDNLVNLFPSNLMMLLLHHLEDIHVSNCASIDVLFDIDLRCVGGMEGGSNNLRRIQAFGLRKLREVWRVKGACNSNHPILGFQAVEYIRIDGCDNLVNLFPSNLLMLLHHLEEIHVSNCASIDVLFDIDLRCVGEMEGGSNNLRRIEAIGLRKLREVWRVKGACNSNLPILGFQAVEYIKIDGCTSLRNVFTPTTIDLDMRALKEISINGIDGWGENKSDNEMVESSQKEEISVISNKEISEVDDNIPSVAFPSYLIHAFNHPRTLQLSGYKGVEVVFEIESSSSRKLATTRNNQQPLLLPYLENLNLYDMESITHVWEYNWNKLLMSRQESESSFHNLTNITLRGCKRIKYLFSPLMAKHLSNLKVVKIFSCESIEEVVSNRDDENEEIATSISSDTNTTFSLHLDFLHLQHLQCLKHIDGVGAKGGDNKRLASNITNVATSVHDKVQCNQVDVASWSLCQYSKKIVIRRCDALLYVIPSHAVGQLPKLDELYIDECRSMREIFEIDNDVAGHNTNVGEGSGDTMTIPRLTNMTNLLELSNLKSVYIGDCCLLENIFTSSTLESLKKLEVLTIQRCMAIQVIVKEENGEHSIGSRDHVVFPRLKSLTLRDLPSLKGFFLGKNIDFQWPLLDHVRIQGCPQMMIFTAGHSMAPKLNYIHTGIGKHSLECGLNFDWTNAAAYEENEVWKSSVMCSTPDPDIINLLQFPWSFSNLIHMDVSWGYESNTIFACNEFLKLQNNNDLEKPPPNANANATQALIEETNDAAWMEANLIIFSKQKQVTTTDHPKSCIWKTTFNGLSNLTTVSIRHCHKLEHVFCYCMVGSLVQLQELNISRCEKMEVIVKQAQDSETKAKEELVMFPCLKSLKLSDLRSFKGFYLGREAFQWPSLDTLEILFCPEITAFTNGQLTTPKLKAIQTSFGLCDVTEEDVNSFIRTKKQEEYRF